MKLLQGDCLELMKSISDKSIDLIFTDPPYKLVSGGRINSLLPDKNAPFSKSGECFSSKTPSFRSWTEQAHRVLKENGYFLSMTNDRNMFSLYNACIDSGFSFCETLVMRKNTAVPSLYFYKSCEFILMFRKEKYRKFQKFGAKNIFDVKMPKGKGKMHPTEKPVSFIETIIEAITFPNDTVLDLFMGSGSTGVACVHTGRDFIGMELDEHYFSVARERIEKEMETWTLELQE